MTVFCIGVPGIRVYVPTFTTEFNLGSRESFFIALLVGKQQTYVLARWRERGRERERERE
jgi:hypothetical protein